MKISNSFKFAIANTLFFGVVGSLIAGVIPTIYFSDVMFDPWMERTDLLFTRYVTGSIGLGFIPASITGYIYSRMYKAEFIRGGSVNFWKEIKLSAIAAVSVVFTICFVSLLGILAFSYADSITSEQFWNVIQFSAVISFFLILFGLVGGVCCSNLIRTWNQRHIPASH